MGVWGVFRSVGFHQGPNDHSFQIFVAFQWVMVVALQYIVQIGYLPGGQLAAMAPTFVAMTLALNLMPAFLDHKMRSLPLEFHPDYYAVAKQCESSTSSDRTAPKDIHPNDSFGERDQPTGSTGRPTDEIEV